MLHLYSDISPYSGYIGPKSVEDCNTTKSYIFRTVVLGFLFQVIYNMLYLLNQA